MAKIIDNYLDREIGKAVIEANRIESENHKSSGKLSAGMLNDPLQWQILKVLGAPQPEFDEYTLRKFKRGKDVEKWFLKEHVKPLDIPLFVEYKNVVGYADAFVDTGAWDFPIGKDAVVEVKSVSNAKFKRILAQGADKGHALQACFYGLARGNNKVAISYIATDDYRVQTFILNVDDYRQEIEDIIVGFDEALRLVKMTKVVPQFVAREKWQENLKYAKWPEWLKLKDEELAEASQKLFAKDK